MGAEGVEAQVAGDVGVVVIGRNEGERLQRCIRSVAGRAAAVVYVDSGSTDGSVPWARSQGVTVVALDMAQPFTAARARNAGWRRLVQDHPGLAWVQFVDGDCEVQPGWLAAARSFVATRPEVGVACGRRRERYPQASIYNQLCDIEWGTPIGPARACGGDALMRLSALQQVGGYRDDLIAGEEPELCVRLRAAGLQVWRLDEEMTLHDAAMTRWGQWWRRNLRSGHAFAEGADLHGAPPERHFVQETRRAWAWGLLLPLVVLAAGLVWPAAWLLALVYPAQVVRLALRLRSQRQAVPWAQAGFMVLGRFPEALGALKYRWSKWRDRPRTLIEYK